MRQLLRVFAALSILLIGSPLRADDPITLQGILTNAAGQPIDGAVTLTVNVYDVESGAAVALNAAPYVFALTLTKGRYSVVLPVDDGLLDGRVLYAGLTVGGDPEMTPRVRIHATPYAHFAYRAGDAASLGGRAAAEFLDATATSQSKAGGLNLATDTGQVGVGTDAPVSKLTVDGSIAVSVQSEAPAVSAGYGKLYARPADGSVASTIDPDTVLLLSFDEVSGSATFTDRSASAHPVTRKGNAVISSFSRHGSGSLYLDGSPGTYLELADAEDFKMGTGPFTVDFWMYVAQAADVRSNVGLVSRYDGGDEWFAELRPSSPFTYGVWNGVEHLDSGTAIIYGEWVHYAMVREGTGANQSKLYINGAEVMRYTDALNHNAEAPLRIGSIWNQPQYDFIGYLDEVRITKGKALFTGNFTPPGPLGQVSGSSGLFYRNELGQDVALGGSLSAPSIPLVTSAQRDALSPVAGLLLFNTDTGRLEVGDGNGWNSVRSTPSSGVGYYDNLDAAEGAGLTDYWLFDGTYGQPQGFNSKTLSNFGTGFVDGDSPFTSLDASERPQVVDFDGSNDYLTYDGRSLSSARFTVSMWVYMDAGNPSGRSYIYDGRVGGGTWYFLYDSNNDPTIHNCSGEFRPANINIQGRWSHHVIRGDGTKLYYTVDGSQTYEVEANGSCVRDDRFMTLGTYFGSRGGSGQYFFNGRIAEVGIYDGTFLSDAEVDAIFAARQPLYYVP